MRNRSGYRAASSEYDDMTVDDLKYEAERAGVKEENRGWATCCPPDGLRDDIIRAIKGSLDLLWRHRRPALQTLLHAATVSRQPGHNSEMHRVDIAGFLLQARSP